MKGPGSVSCSVLEEQQLHLWICIVLKGDLLNLWTEEVEILWNVALFTIQILMLEESEQNIRSQKSGYT